MLAEAADTVAPDKRNASASERFASRATTVVSSRSRGDAENGDVIVDDVRIDAVLAICAST
jgi:hypothetical protein